MKFKRLLVQLSLLVAACPMKSFSATSPFEVIIQPKKNAYSLNENLNAYDWEDGFKISFIVKNISSTKQEFGYWSCSYYENWKTNSDQVSILLWTCKKNGLSPKILKPGESFSGEVPIRVSPMLNEALEKFRLAFLPTQKSKNKPLGTFWSNEIEIKVVE